MWAKDCSFLDRIKRAAQSSPPLFFLAPFDSVHCSYDRLAEFAINRPLKNHKWKKKTKECDETSES